MSCQLYEIKPVILPQQMSDAVPCFNIVKRLVRLQVQSLSGKRTVIIVLFNYIDLIQRLIRTIRPRAGKYLSGFDIKEPLMNHQLVLTDGCLNPGESQAVFC